MKNALIIVVSAILLFSLSGCGCNHQWQNASCTSPVTCSSCGEKAGTPIGHYWTDPSCVQGKTCIICNTTEGTPTGHTWIEATCTAPKTCSICQLSEGDPVEHDWQTSNKKYPKVCSECKVIKDQTTSNTSQNSSTTSNQGSSTTRPTCLLCSNFTSRSSSLYCSTHDCSICSGQAKSNGAGTWGSLCSYHSCQEYGCLGIPIGGTNYCASHYWD